MNLSDKTLSAFLDAELSKQEMELVRQAIIDNEAIAERLAELAMVDTMVQNHYQAIDQQPIPDTTTALLEQSHLTDSNVMAFPWWRKAQQQVQQYAAAIAVIALIAGYGVYKTDAPTQNNTTIAGLDPSIIEQLMHLPSGVLATLNDDSLMSIQLSFYNQQGDFCRQYGLQDPSYYSDNIACQQQGQWQKIANIEYTISQDSQAEYQTASGGSALDSVLDNLMADAPLTLAQEQKVLNNLAIRP
ncbi:anti-sigma factor family protein [Shewanella livingstonensis]|uniref:Anti-sigma factor n=1 Tax=Shewanella livingstonensis TaxID=150120 RepID=A0A3G8LRW7_9GAMM|nr:hypothetical protein [Shewanella livingstonensis]AZG71955.1 hypothetical protein EGC82_03775 [Shewanella livingstonensis]